MMFTLINFVFLASILINIKNRSQTLIRESVANSSPRIRDHKRYCYPSAKTNPE